MRVNDASWYFAQLQNPGGINLAANGYNFTMEAWVNPAKHGSGLFSYENSWGNSGVNGGAFYSWECNQLHDPLMPYLGDEIYDKLVVCPFVSREFVVPYHVPSTKVLTSRDYYNPPESRGVFKDSCYMYRGWSRGFGPDSGFDHFSDTKPMRSGDDFSELTGTASWIIAEDTRYALAYLTSNANSHKSLGGNFFFTDGSVRFRPFAPGSDEGSWLWSTVWMEN